MNKQNEQNYARLGEYIAPQARRLLDRLQEDGIGYRLAIIDDIRRAWPWGHHGTFTRVAIFVDPAQLNEAQEIETKLLKIEI
jgi:hypothetical protein